jgi:hypothetical protein
MTSLQQVLITGHCILKILKKQTGSNPWFANSGTLLKKPAPFRFLIQNKIILQKDLSIPAFFNIPLISFQSFCSASFAESCLAAVYCCPNGQVQ